MNDASGHRRENRRFFARLLVLLVMLVYFGIYIWARTTGLIVGGVFGPYGGMPTAYTIVPIGNLNLVALPKPGESEAVFDQRQTELDTDRRRSLQLWRCYAWLAVMEEKVQRVFR